MMKLKLMLLTLLFTCAIQKSQAINRSENGLGEALIVPFYTVKNDLKTQLVIKNFTPDVKAISVKFKEKFMGIHVLNFNVYLAPFDEWEGELSRVTHNIWGDATQIETLDNSCVPFMSIEQDFLPFEIEIYFPNSVDFMQRSHIGYIEVVEMGTVVDPVANYINHSKGVPNDCQAIEDFWNSNGEWDQNSNYSMAAATGGISAFAEIVDQEGSVISGPNFEGFLPESQNILHFEPGSLRPDFFMSSLLAIDEFFETDWSQTWRNINPSDALLLTNKISGSFDLDINKQTEWLVTLTNRFNYVFVNGASSITKPFTNGYVDQISCESLDVMVYDENGVLQSGLNNESFQLCESVNVIGVQGQETAVPALHETFDQIIDVGNLSKGYIELKTQANHWTMGGVNVADPDEPIIYYGLPMIANAYEKQAASASGTFKTLEHHRKAVLDKIFISGF